MAEIKKLENEKVIVEVKKFENTKPETDVKPDLNASDIPAVETKVADDISELVEQEAKPLIHNITYIGNGVFKDAVGIEWAKDDNKTFTDAEYNQRSDIRFMVGYGAMKKVTI